MHSGVRGPRGSGPIRDGIHEHGEKVDGCVRAPAGVGVHRLSPFQNRSVKGRAPGPRQGVEHIGSRRNARCVADQTGADNRVNCPWRVARRPACIGMVAAYCGIGHLYQGIAMATDWRGWRGTGIARTHGTYGIYGIYGVLDRLRSRWACLWALSSPSLRPSGAWPCLACPVRWER